MKRLIQIAALIVAGFTASISPAKAGVPCSVPFNLTNGTTADATQVMANYNAILSCLSTSAAANGANTDITSLGALTTPITPAQGGAQALCGASGFYAVNDATFPNTSVDITYKQAVVTNALNAVQYSTSGSLVLNFSTVGIDGLDTGVQTASTTYYIFLIGNGTVVHSLASLSSTAPTLPGGYTFTCRVGSLRVNGSTQLYAFFQQGRTVNILNVLIGDAAFQNVSTQGNCGTNTFAAVAFAGIPATAGYATGYITQQFVNGAIKVVRSLAQGATLVHLEGGTSPGFTQMQFTAPLVTPSTLVWCNDTSTNQSVTVNGWIDSVNVN